MTMGKNGRTEGTDLAPVRGMIQGGKYGPAIRKLRGLLKQHDSTAARYLLGVACFESGKAEDALAAFEQVRAAHPEIPELQTNLGAAYAAVGRWEDAARVLQEALDENPDDLNAMDNLIQVYLETGDPESALEVCKTRIDKAPDDPEGYFLRGNIHLLLGRTDRAIADYETALKGDPEDLRYHYNLGYAFYTCGRKQDAIKSFQAFCRIDRKIAALYTYKNSQTLFHRAQALRQQNRRLRNRKGHSDIIGTSPQMEDLFEILDRVAPGDVTVLIRGASGTGKELFARALHAGSPRRDGPFVPFNVAAMPDDLVESELFGYRKGAFTGAVQDQPGLFETASGGTLFLDEIAEMSPRAQAKILRAIEERKIRRLGDRKEIAIDVRLIAATHQNLYQRVQEGRFRSDLYYRLKVVELYIPLLRERPRDIKLLAEHFLDQYVKRHGRSIHSIDPAAMARLKAYDWPGNVRELRNAVEHAVIMAREESITEDDLPPEIVPENRPGPRTGRELPDDPEAEKVRILQALEDTRWHRGQAAERLGISRRHIYRLMEKYGINEE